MLIRLMVGVDDPDLRERVAAHLEKPDIHLAYAGSRETTLAKLGSTSCDLVVVDGSGAAELDDPLRSLERLPDRPRVVVLLSGDQPEVGARLLAAGVMAVLDSSLDDPLLGAALDGLVRQRRRERRATVSARSRPASVLPLRYESAGMAEVVETARKVAMADSSVLLLGETGVGKERIAELIHQSSARSEGPFVPVNCAAIPTELFEAELFGHEKGAFTGAHRARRGLFEHAHEGTLFLDEIGELPGHLQPKLLRALQERRIRPLGSDRAVEVDTRVIAATQRDLAAEMDAHSFRRDLYYRLAVVEIVIPPLRTRPDDIEALAQAFVERFAVQLGREVAGFEASALRALRSYDWPGNVRELINVVERAVLLCDSDRIAAADLPASIGALQTLQDPHLEPAVEGGSPGTVALDEVVHIPEAWTTETWKHVREGLLVAGERAYLSAVLRQTQGRVGEAARRAGLSSRALFEKMRRHGLRKEDFR